MIFTPSGKPFKPIHIQIIRLWWEGKTKTEIQNDLGVSYTMVENAIDSPYGQQLLAQLESTTFDSIKEVHNLIQAHAVDLVREKINLALHSHNEHVRSRNTAELLGIAGHTAMQRVAIVHTDPLIDKYKDKTEVDIRRELMGFKEETGPDGRPLN